MRTRPRRIVMAVLLGLLASGLLGAAQYRDDQTVFSLQFLPDRAAWVLTPALPDRVRLCAWQDPDGTLRGCVTAKELRDKAEQDRNLARRK